MNIETINNDMKEAMKSGNKFELNVLRMLKSALQNEKIAKNHDLDENEIIAVIKKQVKVRKDSLKEYQEYNREDLVEGLTKEIDILTKYLPEELSEEEIDKVINDVFTKLNPTELNALIATKADMSLVSKKVKEKLS